MVRMLLLPCAGSKLQLFTRTRTRNDRRAHKPRRPGGICKILNRNNLPESVLLQTLAISLQKALMETQPAVP